MKDPLLEPDLSWRHRFKTVCGDLEIPDHRRMAIMGHAEAGASGVYGETGLEKARAIINGVKSPLDSTTLQR